MAYGILDEFLENDIKISEKMAVTGYEYVRERYSHSPLLTTYQRNRKALGTSAVEILNGKPYENFRLSRGRLIQGESCGCGASFSNIQHEMKSLQTKQMYDFLNLYSQIDHRLTECRNIDEFVQRCWDFQFIIRGVNKMYMCLYENWYDDDRKYDNVVRYNMLTYEKPTVFHKDEFSNFMTGKAAPYYICPLFFGDRELGYVVLRYENADCFDHIFRNWLKSISNALEILIMKNDIRYLTACQNLSEQHDSMTSMYNEIGVRNAFHTSDKNNLYMVMLKICLFDKDFTAINENEKIYAILDAAEGVKQFSGDNNICSRIDNNTFICLIKSNSGEKFLTELLSSIIYQHTSYMNKYGIDSFVCSSCKCESKEFDELSEICQNDIMHEIEIISKRKCNKYYDEMAELRRYIYMNPNETFQTESLHKKFEGSIGHLQVIYKQCFFESFHQDCISARIAKARFILAVTKMSVQETAFECGYSDNKYFMRQFLNETGITANQFRNVIKYS